MPNDADATRLEVYLIHGVNRRNMKEDEEMGRVRRCHPPDNEPTINHST